MALFEKKTIIKNEIDYDKLAEAIGKYNKNEIDYDRLAEAIVKASKAEEKEEQKKREEILKAYRQKYKIDDNDTGFSFKNFWRCMRAVLEYGKKQSEVPVMTFDLMRGISSVFFFLIELAFIVFGFIIIGYAGFMLPRWINRLAFGFLGLVFVFFSCFFRIARIEVSVMEDKDRLNIVFSSIMALLSVIFAIIAIFQGGD